MSRIEELSTLVKNQTTLVDNLESLIEKERLLKTRYANELFEATKALEAQERKPREFVLGLDDAGNMCSISKYGSVVHYHLHGYSGGYPRNLIPLIEKLPVKVTREMAVTMHMATVHMGDDIGLVPRAVATLKAAGIDAEPSND